MSVAPDPRSLLRASPVQAGARAPGREHGGRAGRIPLVVERRFVVVDGHPDERIAAIAAVQHGCVARWQLLTAGVSDEMIRWRLKRGVLVRQHSGVYAYGHALATRHSEEIAALLTRGTAALICAHRAAGMYGFRPMCEGVDLLVPGIQGGGRREGIRIHRTAHRDRLQPDYVDGVPVVSPAWALLEIAAELSRRTLEIALDEAFGTGRVNRGEVRRLAEAHPHRAGSGLLRDLLRGRPVGNPSGSPGQERLLALVRQAGLPDPDMDARIGGGFGVDLLWRRERVAVEYDSYGWHSSPRAWARDRRKDRFCAETGIELMRVTDEDLAEAPKLAARLAWLIASRGAGD